MRPSEPKLIRLAVGRVENSVAVAMAADLAWDDDPRCRIRAIGCDDADGGMSKDPIQLVLKAPDKYGANGGWRNPLHTDIDLLAFRRKADSENGGYDEYRHLHGRLLYT